MDIRVTLLSHPLMRLFDRFGIVKKVVSRNDFNEEDRKKGGEL